jgi:hypothetical protein
MHRLHAAMRRNLGLRARAHDPRTGVRGEEAMRRSTGDRTYWLHAESTRVRVLRFTAGGVAVAADEGAALPGAVDLYEDARHLATCLVVVAGEAEGERHYDFKRWTVVSPTPPRDHDPLALPSGY